MKVKNKIIKFSLALLICMGFLISPMVVRADESYEDYEEPGAEVAGYETEYLSTDTEGYYYDDTTSDTIEHQVDVHVPPTVYADFRGTLLQVHAVRGSTAIEYVSINDIYFSHREGTSIVVDISQFIVTGDTIIVYAVDYEDNASNVLLLTPPARLPQITPDGQATVTDHLTDEDGIEFFTITTPVGNVFHLIIDHGRESNNVYFLNAVTEWDLLLLAEQAELSEPPVIGASVVVQPPTPEPVPVVASPIPTTEPPEPLEETESSLNRGGDAGRGANSQIIVFVVVGVVGFAIAYYIKIYKPKKQRELYVEDEDEFEELADSSDTEADAAEFDEIDTSDDDED